MNIIINFIVVVHFYYYNIFLFSESYQFFKYWIWNIENHNIQSFGNQGSELTSICLERMIFHLDIQCQFQKLIKHQTDQIKKKAIEKAFSEQLMSSNNCKKWSIINYQKINLIVLEVLHSKKFKPWKHCDCPIKNSEHFEWDGYKII